MSTADDFLTFAKMLLQRGTVNGIRLLKPETVEVMTTNRLTAARRDLPFMGRPFFRSQGFGLGVSVVTDPAEFFGAGPGSFGWGSGFGGWWQADPENQVLLLWLQQCVPASPTDGPSGPPRMPGASARSDFQREAYAALAG